MTDLTWNQRQRRAKLLKEEQRKNDEAHNVKLTLMQKLKKFLRIK
jgi:hypothetical protein